MNPFENENAGDFRRLPVDFFVRLSFIDDPKSDLGHLPERLRRPDDEVILMSGLEGNVALADEFVRQAFV